ncbi:MAG: M12 family metallo-peptidase [Acidobacteriota bacterium]
MLRVCFVGFSFLVLVSSVGAQSLFTLEDRASRPASFGPESFGPDLVGAAELYRIQVEPALVASAPERLEIVLPDGRVLEAEQRRVRTYSPTWKSWSGSLRLAGRGEHAPGYIHLNYHGDSPPGSESLTGILNLSSGEQYQISIVDGEHLLVRLADDNRPPSCGLDVSGRDLAADTGLGSGFEPRGAAPDAAPDAAPLVGTAQIDVLAVYPKAVSGLSQLLTLQFFVQDSISLANDVFDQSNVDAEYRLVGIEPLLQMSQPSSGVGASVGWMNDQGPGSELAQLRTTFAADMVALFVPASWNGTAGACAWANIPEAPASPGADWGIRGESGTFNERAFSAHRIGCGLNDLTFAHELGHNFGMRHETETAGSAAHLFSYGRGYDYNHFGVTFASLMACHNPSGSTDIFAGVCNREPRFSDPTARPATGTSDRDNARVARDQVGIFANFLP